MHTDTHIPFYIGFEQDKIPTQKKEHYLVTFKKDVLFLHTAVSKQANPNTKEIIIWLCLWGISPC